jgi:hypothetical protein
MNDLEKMRVNPFLVLQIPLTGKLKEQVAGKSAREAMDALWNDFLHELNELLPLIEEGGYKSLRAFYEARFFAVDYDEEFMKELPFGAFLYSAYMKTKEAIKNGEPNPPDWRKEWLSYLEYQYFLGSFLAGVLRYIELRYQTVTGLSLALLKVE